MNGRMLLAALVCTALWQPSQAIAQRRPAGAEDAPVSLRLVGVPDTLVNALYADGAIYLPLVGIFRWLHVDVAYDSTTQRAHGKFLRPGRPYLVDPIAGIATMGQRREKFASDQAISTANDLYIRPALLDRVFHISGTFDLSTLTVALTSADTFPVMEEGGRELERRRRLALDRPPPPAPLRYGRRRELLDGFLLQYDVSTLTGSYGPPTLRSTISAGGELLGGELDGSLQLDRQGADATARLTDASWHYVFDLPRRLLTEVAVGALPSVGLQGHAINGLKVTNEPFQPRYAFGDQNIFGLTGPNWEVELYVGDHLIGFTRADPTGRYQFDLPLTYGSATVSIRAYGPTGGMETDQRRVEVPFSLVPARSLDYNLALGRDIASGNGIGQGRVQYGVTQAITVVAGGDYVQTPGASVLPYLGVTTKVLSNLLLSGIAAPQALSRASLGYVTPSLARLQVDYTKYALNLPYNPLRADRELRTEASLPLGYRGVRASFYTSSSLLSYFGGGSGLDLNAQALLSVGTLRPSFGLRRSEVAAPQRPTTVANRATIGLLQFLTTTPRFLAPLRGSLASASVDFTLPDQRVAAVHAGISQNIGRNGRLSLSFDQLQVAHSGQLQLRYDLHLPTTQASTTITRSAAYGSAVGQSLRGSAAFDPDTRRWLFSSRLGLGRAGASFRMFVDANGNGQLDPGEEVIKGGQVRLGQSVSTAVDDDGTIRVWDLLANYRYDATVDESGIANPLWRPAYARFALITDPNTFKPVEIPFYAAGEVQGSVSMQSAQGASSPLPGLSIVLQRNGESDRYTVITFSDGSFYYPGLPPGSYTATPDPTQLRLLKVTSSPATRVFTVPRTAQGITISGLDFTLIPTPGAAQAPATHP